MVYLEVKKLVMFPECRMEGHETSLADGLWDVGKLENLMPSEASIGARRIHRCSARPTSRAGEAEEQQPGVLKLMGDGVHTASEDAVTKQKRGGKVVYIERGRFRSVYRDANGL